MESSFCCLSTCQRVRNDFSLTTFTSLPKRTYNYKHDTIVPVKCVMYSYTGCRNHLHFIWKIQESATEGKLFRKKMNFGQELWKTIPTYSTRAMRRNLSTLLHDFTICISQGSLSKTDW